MKQTNLRSILLISILIIALSIFTGCGGNKDASAPPVKTPDNNQSPDNEQIQDKEESVIELISRGSQIDEMYYELVMIGAGLSSESKSWLKGDKMKIDTTINGQRLISIFDLVKGEVISYTPGENMAMKTSEEEYPGMDNITPIDYINRLDKGEFVSVGTEKFNGMECQVIQIASGTSLFKQWISTEHGIVVKVEEDYNGQKIVMEFKNLKVGPGSVTDDVFAVPQGLEIFDMNEMMPS